MLISPLESRRLLSSWLSAGVLTFAGTSSTNTVQIVVSGSNLKVTESGQPIKYYASSSVSKIYADLGGGKDYFTMSTAVYKPATVLGGAGNDTLAGGSGHDLLDGGGDHDQLFGLGGNDTLRGGSGVDSLYGGDGNDRLDGGLQSDYLDGGGGGHDAADYSARTTTIVAMLVVDEGSATGSFRLHGTGGQAAEYDNYYRIEELWGGSNPDQLRVEGHGGAYTTPALELVLRGNGGSDWLSTSADYLFEGAATTRISMYAGSGNDSLTCNTEDPELPSFKPEAHGDSGNDTFFINHRQPVTSIHDTSGTDLVNAYFYDAPSTTYAFTIPGSVENALIRGGKVVVTGHSLASRITLQNTSATVYAGAGNDTVIGSGGADRIYGGGDNDSLEGGGGNDTIYGEAGGDVLSGQSGNDRLDGGDGNDSIYGGTGNDVLTGGAGADRFFGQDGNDLLYANDGNAEYVDGGAGFDKARRDMIDTLVSIEGTL